MITYGLQSLIYNVIFRKLRLLIYGHLLLLLKINSLLAINSDTCKVKLAENKNLLDIFISKLFIFIITHYQGQDGGSSKKSYRVNKHANVREK
jgi:hypothetical protein